MTTQTRILIIEKSIDFIKFLSHCLQSSKKYNFIIDFYTDSTEALSACLTNAHDVILIGNIEEDNEIDYVENIIDYGCITPIILMTESSIETSHDSIVKNEISLNMLEKSIIYSIERGKMSYNAKHDILTGLLNRTAFLESLEGAIEKSKQDKQFTYGVLFIDVDRFKYVNDTLGHNVGDRLLVSIGEKIKSCLHKLDIVARYGGDEFSVLLLGMTRETIESFAYKIKESFNESMFVEEYEFNNTISVGVVICQGNYYDPQEIIRDADIAMYYNKNKEIDKPVFFDLNMRKSLERKYFLEKEIRKAIQKNEFNIVYQPIIDSKTNKIVSMEALMRWKVNEINISPNEFIPIAEDLYLIHNLSEIVIDTVSKDIKKFNISENISISINISPKQLTNQSIVDVFTKKLSDIPPEQIIIEITESSLLNGYKKTSQENILKFKNKGFKIHLDDYGTGYSALAHIINFPLDGIKIDKSIIDNIENNNISKNVTKSIIDLAHNLNMYVIAEGIEREEQKIILQDYGCDQFQGFYYSKPTTIEEIFHSSRKSSSDSSSSSL